MSAYRFECDVCENPLSILLVYKCLLCKDYGPDNKTGELFVGSCCRAKHEQKHKDIDQDAKENMWLWVADE